MRLFNLLGGGRDPFEAFIDEASGVLSALMIGMLAIIAAAAVVFAIWVGFRLAKAEDEGKRKEAKQQLLWSIIAVVATVALFLLLQLVFNGEMFPTVDYSEKLGDDSIVGEAAGKVIQFVNLAIGALLSLGAIAGMCFAVYVGVRLAMAQDEGKRKEAKQQLLWTLIAVVGAIALAMIISTVVSILIDAI